MTSLGRPSAVLELDGSVWDAVVIGAGPSGAVSAYGLARSGLRTLIVETRKFPRPKACGGCLNGRSIGILDSLGLGGVLDSLGGKPFSSLNVRTDRRRSASLPLPAGLALTRETLDRALVDAAVAAGARLVDGISARVVELADRGAERRSVVLRSPGVRPFQVVAGVVVAADGLGHPSLGCLPEFRTEREGRSRVGLGTVVGRLPPGYTAGSVQMAIAPEGYVGMVEAEGGTCVIAAAVDAGYLREAAGPSDAVEGLLGRTGSPIPEFSGRWQGTGALTGRLTRPVGWRVFVVGDAAGYVEPFTGEGIAWALADAAGIPPFVERGVSGWTDRIERDWMSARGRVTRGQRFSRWTRRVLRSGPGLDVALRVATRCPRVAARWARAIHASPVPPAGVAR